MFKLGLEEDAFESPHFPRRSDISNSVRLSWFEEESKATESLPSSRTNDKIEYF